MKMLKLALAVSTAGAALVVPFASGSATAATAARLPCSASMSVPRPAHGQNTAVRIKTTAGARVAAMAHYKSSTVKKIGYANSAGRATVTFKVGDVVYGRTVPVVVHIYKGANSGKCSTSFTPTAPPRVYRVGSCRASGDYSTCDEAGNATKPTVIQVLVTASPNQSVLVSWDVVCSAGKARPAQVVSSLLRHRSTERSDTPSPILTPARSPPVPSSAAAARCTSGLTMRSDPVADEHN